MDWVGGVQWILGGNPVNFGEDPVDGSRNPVDFGGDPVDFPSCRMDHWVAELVVLVLECSVGFLDLDHPAVPALGSWGILCCPPGFGVCGCAAPIPPDPLSLLIVPAKTGGKFPLKSVWFWDFLPAFPLPVQPSRASFRGR